MPAKNILIVDDDRAFAHSLAVMLGTAGYRTCTSHDAAGALLLARGQPVDCAVIDYNLGATLGTALVAKLEEEGFPFPKIILTGYGDVRAATTAMKLGASDFLEKGCPIEDLLEAISSAIDIAELNKRQTDSVREARRMLRTLTGRECEIVDAIAAGHSSKQIADALCVSQRTVEAHRANVLQKLGVANTAALVRLAVLSGLAAP